MLPLVAVGCGSVERGGQCSRDSDCAELAASCEVWLSRVGEGRRTCEVVCTRDGDCSDGQSCEPFKDEEAETCQ
jgi:hypothetical protein